MSLCHDYSVLKGKALCFGPISRTEESYGVSVSEYDREVSD